MSNQKNESNLTNNNSSSTISLLNPFNLLLVLVVCYFGLQYVNVQEQLKDQQLRHEAQSEMIDKLRGFNR